MKPVVIRAGNSPDGISRKLSGPREILVDMFCPFRGQRHRARR